MPPKAAQGPNRTPATKNSNAKGFGLAAARQASGSRLPIAQNQIDSGRKHYQQSPNNWMNEKKKYADKDS